MSPPLHLLASLVSFLFRGKEGGPHTFVNRGPRSQEQARKKKTKWKKKDDWPGWIRKRWKKRRRWREGGGDEGLGDEGAKDRMSEESVMRSLNTNAARPMGLGVVA